MPRIRSKTRPRCRTIVQIISIFALGAALTNVFGRMVGNQRQGWAVLAVMGVLFIAGVIICYAAEAHGNDALNALGLTGGNMEGKEVRFGIAASALFAVITTAASCGAVNAMHDSLHRARRHDPAHQHPTRRDHRRRRRLRHVRHAALRHHLDLRRRLDGRPHARICRQEDRGEGSEDGDARDPVPAADDLGLTAVAMLVPPAVAAMNNPGPHGFTEILYAYTSQAGNNGSAFAGLTANTPF